MAMEKAVVSTTIGAEGLPLTDGVELLLADEPAAFAEAVVHLLTDKTYATELGQRAAAIVRKNYSWRQVTEKFISICLDSARSLSPAVADGSAINREGSLKSAMPIADPPVTASGTELIH
jgi:hypothetical protein